MDNETRIEIVRLYDGVRVNIDENSVWLRGTKILLDHEEARAVAKAIAEYDKALAALGYAP